MGLKHILEAQQFTSDLLFSLFRRADELRNQKDKIDKLKGKILATLFFEPSTRTRFSFESAMIRMGGQVITAENAKENSSAVKGESIEDTARIVSAYADCIVMRHKEDGTALKAASVSRVPVINAGDGKGEHPTQALLDAYTIYKELGRLENFKLAIVGDLASGRTVRSLCFLLGNLKNIEIIFVSPENLKVGEDIKEYLKEKGINVREEQELNKILTEVDVVYLTRIQKERISLEDYEKAKGKFVINSENFSLVRQDARLMHPLPHCEEIDLPIEVEQKDPRVAYFRQAENGLYVRMALLEHVLA